MRIPSLALGILLFGLVLPSAVLKCQSSPQQDAASMDPKQREAKAKQIIAEAKSLEKQGKLVEAKEKYLEAEGTFSTKDGLNGIERVRHAEDHEVDSAIADAHRFYSTGKYAEASARLESAEGIEPENFVVHYDLALCYAKLNQRADAVQHLDLAGARIHDNKLRTAVLEFGVILSSGALAPSSPGPAKNQLVGFNQAFLDWDRTAEASGSDDPKPDPSKHADLCGQAAQVKDLAASNAAVSYDLAKCAEEDGRPEDALRLAGQYLSLAPQALDSSDVRDLQQAWTSLAAIPGDAGAQVRLHYANAARYLDYRRYDRALREYEAAEKAMPDFPQTQWRLGMLHEAFGNVPTAKEHFAKFRDLSSDDAEKAEAAHHLDSIEQWRAEYDSDVEDAQDMLSGLLLQAMGLSSEGQKHKTKFGKGQKKASKRYLKIMSADEAMSPPYVRSVLEHAQDELEEATSLMPLGPEANELLALIQFEGNNWTGAYHCFDAVASQGLPVSFYAQVNSERDSKIVRAAKLEVAKETIRIVYLSSYNAKKKVTGPPDKPAGEDDLGELVISPQHPPASDVESLTISLNDLKGVETEQNFVVLKLAKDKLYLAPVYMVAFAPVEGQASRRFGNEYTRLFVRYLGFENARLGKEGMTFGEKFHLTIKFAELGYEVFDAVNSGGVNSYNAFRVLRQVARQLNIDLNRLERSMTEQRRAVDGMQFKVIPTQTAQLEFRDKF